MAANADGPTAMSDPLRAMPSRALTLLPMTVITICVSLGAIGCFGGVVALFATGDASDGNYGFVLLVGVGFAFLALAMACACVAGLVWYVTPAWLQSAMAERYRSKHLAPHAYTLAFAWCGFVLTVATTFVAVVALTAPATFNGAFTTASFRWTSAIAGAVWVIAFAPAIRLMWRGLGNRES